MISSWLPNKLTPVAWIHLWSWNGSLSKDHLDFPGALSFQNERLKLCMQIERISPFSLNLIIKRLLIFTHFFGDKSYHLFQFPPSFNLFAQTHSQTDNSVNVHRSHLQRWKEKTVCDMKTVCQRSKWARAHWSLCTKGFKRRRNYLTCNHWLQWRSNRSLSWVEGRYHIRKLTMVAQQVSLCAITYFSSLYVPKKGHPWFFCVFILLIFDYW